MLSEILDALFAIRAPRSLNEYDLHALVASALQNAQIEFVHEASLGARRRIDFLAGDVGIELKRGRPNAAQLTRQLKKYMESEQLSALIIVCEKNAPLPSGLLGKPLFCVSLQKLWGVALSNDESEGPPSEAMAASPDTEEDMPLGALSGGSDEEAEDAGDALSSFQDESAMENIPLPSYLQTDTHPPYLYGTLSYNRRAKCWTVKAEPSVTEMCKRLFPGSSGAKRGEARFFAHRRVVGDLCWLMQRYPLAVAPQDQQRWAEAVEDAKKDYRRREFSHIAPQTAQPPSNAFHGTLKDFQKRGLAFLLIARRALLADEMGLGKTVQALAAVASLKSYPALLVVPPHLIRNWQNEIARFLSIGGREPNVHVIRGLKPYPLPDADLYIVHYLLLRGWKEALQKYTFKLVLFDEIQELRHSGTEKYSAASLLSSACDRVYGLSGTPIYNQGGEIWNVVNILDFHFLGDYESFTREWCYGYGNNIVIKPELLGDYLRREGLMLRRTKQEVLPELPEKRRLVQAIDADDVLYTTLMQPVVEKLARWRTDNTLSRSERALLEDRISQEERQATGIAKAPYVCQFVRALVTAGERVLLFAHHHAVMDIYKKELHAFSPAFITGRETGAKKEESVARFMEGKTDLCCISLRAASGLNLQRASCVVFGELDWSPAVHSQAEDRAHRIGQKDSLLCYYLVSPRGSDSDIQEALGLKVSQFLSLMGDAPQTEEQAREDASIARMHVEKLIQRLDAEQKDTLNT